MSRQPEQQSNTRARPTADTTRDIQVLKTYGAAPYGAELRKLEKEIKDKQQTINEKIGVKVRQ